MTEHHAKGGSARAAVLSPERRREIAVEAARARWTDKYVYVIGYEIDDSAVKIGVAKNPQTRLVGLQTGSHLKMVCHHVERTDRLFPALLVERVCHHLLRDKRLAGEWFSVSAQDAISTVRQAVQIVKDGCAREHLPVSRASAPLKLPHRKWTTLEDGRRVVAGAEAAPVTLRMRKGSALMRLWIENGRKAGYLTAMLHMWAEKYGDGA